MWPLLPKFSIFALQLGILNVLLSLLHLTLSTHLVQLGTAQCSCIAPTFGTLYVTSSCWHTLDALAPLLHPTPSTWIVQVFTTQCHHVAFAFSTPNTSCSFQHSPMLLSVSMSRTLYSNRGCGHYLTIFSVDKGLIFSDTTNPFPKHDMRQTIGT